MIYNLGKFGEDWDVYARELDHRPVSILVNLSAIRRASSSGKPWLWHILARGLITGPGSRYGGGPPDNLQSWVIAELADGHSCEFVGGMDSGTARELFFYSVSKQGFRRSLQKARSVFPGCEIHGRSECDSEWRQYRHVLYPGPIQMQRIRNRRVLEQLAIRGDNHAIERPVDHELYFWSNSDSADFGQAAAKMGFRARFTRDLPDFSGSPRPIFVSVVRSDPVTSDHISQVAAKLLILAARFDGEYDGWVARSVNPSRKAPPPGDISPGVPTSKRWIG
jgi:regulator of RNase E activity RraB